MKKLAAVSFVLVVLLAWVSLPHGILAAEGLQYPENAKTVDEYLRLRGVKNPGNPIVKTYEPISKDKPATHPRFLRGDSSGLASSDTYYWSGMGTADSSYSGLIVRLYGGSITNQNPSAKLVRLTPHLIPDQTADYLALVAEDEGVFGELKLRGFQNGRTGQWGQQTATLYKNQWYDLKIVINPADNPPYTWGCLLWDTWTAIDAFR